jgi:hypothetical protein
MPGWSLQQILVHAASRAFRLSINVRRLLIEAITI